MVVSFNITRGSYGEQEIAGDPVRWLWCRAGRPPCPLSGVRLAGSVAAPRRPPSCPAGCPAGPGRAAPGSWRLGSAPAPPRSRRAALVLVFPAVCLALLLPLRPARSPRLAGARRLLRVRSVGRRRLALRLAVPCAVLPGLRPARVAVTRGCPGLGPCRLACPACWPVRSRWRLGFARPRRARRGGGCP